ncbi:deoxyribose-phosphate aldolase [Sediminicola luteus]|uniref:deoxyribose-phosphate aldolase n=1 Tax=Sediminicola luteus TaxID=319238 RepID=UPI0026890B7A|nr:deoxyribose-phosphate aldolase [Sediminicola luteus]
MIEIQRYVDHTLLKPTATINEIQQLCEEAVAHNFYAVCVNGCHVAPAKEFIHDSPVKLAAVIGFPLGAMTTEAKVCEARQCVSQGADEIDMVLNLGHLKAQDYMKVESDIKAVKDAIGDACLKVIFETCFLDEFEIQVATRLSISAGADYIKTSTGFGTGGATLKDVETMKRAAEGKVKIKASGGIRDQKTALAYIEAGVDRIGTSSGIKIVQGV